MISEISKNRFYAFVNKTKTCWLWTGTPASKRYGTQTIDKRNYLAHRLSWMIHNGEIPKGLFVLHKCDVMRCVNPDHLFIGTARDNFEDAVSKGRRKFIGKDNPKAKLTENQVRQIRIKYVPWKYGLEKLAKEYGVQFSTIWMIIKRKHWKHI